MKKLTIFTPTYNRGKYLERLYATIVVQECLNQCEWIIVDDGSSDDTEIIIKELINKGTEIEILYFRQEHGGKHRAINRALDMASGEYFFIVDSDDYLYDNAIPTVISWINSVDNKLICAVSGLRVFPNGDCVGGNPNMSKDEYKDASLFDRYKLNLGGDKAEVYRTDILKEYRFPEFEGEYFVTEDVCWNAIAADGYVIRWFNHPIYVCEYLEDGLTKTGANEISGHIENFKGYSYYIKQNLLLIHGMSKLAYIVDYRKTVKKMNMTLKDQAGALKMSKVRYVGLVIIGSIYDYAKKLRCIGK